MVSIILMRNISVGMAEKCSFETVGVSSFITYLKYQAVICDIVQLVNDLVKLSLHLFYSIVFFQTIVPKYYNAVSTMSQVGSPQNPPYFANVAQSTSDKIYLAT